jgi:hypothetical protein
MTQGLLALPVLADQPQGVVAVFQAPQGGEGVAASLEKGDEAGFLEVMVAGQSFGDGALRHHNEGDAVGQGPIFVRAVVVKATPSSKRVCVGGTMKA